MSSDTARRDELIAALRAYQELCNQFDMEAAMEYFTEGAAIVIDGACSKGTAEVFRIHEGDRGARLIVDFTDFELDGDTLGCFFHAESEIDRALGLRGIARWNRITFVDNKIHYWDIDRPSEAEIARRRDVIGPFWEWAEANHSDLVKTMRSHYTYEAGHAAAQLADHWRQKQ